MILFYSTAPKLIFVGTDWTTCAAVYLNTPDPCDTLDLLQESESTQLPHHERLVGFVSDMLSVERHS